MKTKNIDQLIDQHVGPIGSKERNVFEAELKVEIIGQTIKEIRNKKNLTQEQLGNLVGVKKAQISKIENNFTDARLNTILKVFKALDSKLSFKVEVE